VVTWPDTLSALEREGIRVRLFSARWFRFSAITLGRTVLLQRDVAGTARGAATLRHEAVHARDFARVGPLLWLTYVLPFPVGPLSLRWWWELRAYRESLRALGELHGELRPADVEWAVRQFTGRAYLWMLPFPGLVRRLLVAGVAGAHGDRPGGAPSGSGPA
jgi:hypothetical protein